MSQIVTLITDFGIKDYFVGVIKGVILSINPNATIVDINHQIKPYDIFGAALNIKNSYKFFPRGTVNLVVVDPGVGSKRKPILVNNDNHFFIGPDNGVFSFIYKDSISYKIYKLENEKYFLDPVSSTFHGRDVFAPVAAYVSLGESSERFGKEILNPQSLDVPEPEFVANKINGEVIYVDQFGNLLTNIDSNSVDKSDEIFIDDKVIKGVSDSYSDLEIGKLVAVYGSSGYLEISACKDNASKYFSIEDLKVSVIKK